MLKKLGLLILLTVSVFGMHNVGLNVNNKDLEIGLKFDMGQFNDNIEPDIAFIGGKFIHGDYTHGDINSTYMKDYAEISFLMIRNVQDSGFSIGLGMKINSTKNFITVPLGMEFKYKILHLKALPMSVGAMVYYAPDVLSLSDAKNFFEYRLEYDIEVMKHANVTMGYRNIDTNYIDARGDLNYNHSFYVGFRFSF